MADTKPTQRKTGEKAPRPEAKATAERKEHAAEAKEAPRKSAPKKAAEAAHEGKEHAKAAAAKDTAPTKAAATTAAAKKEEGKEAAEGAKPKKEHKEGAHREAHKPSWTGPVSTVKVNVYGLDGKAKGKIALPKAFDTQVRSDLIHAAVVRAHSNRRQTYGPNPRSGHRHSVEQWGKGHGVARVQRVKGERRGAQSPNNVGGRRAHPPRLNRDWDRKMNARERRFARLSALSAAKDASMVKARGHRFKEELTLPVVVEEEFERMMDDVEQGYTSSMIGTLEALGLYEDVVRARDGRHERAGHGKLRGRRFRTPTSLLIVVSDVEKVRRFVRNLPGIDVVTPSLLSTERLAPGGQAGRLTVISVQALESMMGW